MSLTWVNGKNDVTILNSDRGFLFGDGCFTTIAKFKGKIERLDAHLERIHGDANRLLLPAVDVKQLRDEIELYAAQVPDGVIRLTITRGSGGAGYALPTVTQTSRVLQWRDASPLIQQNAKLGIAMFACSTWLSAQPRLAGVKHCNRLENILARAEVAENGFAEGLMCDESGHLVEGTFSNIFWRENDGWFTPQLDRCGISGVMRAEILTLMRQYGIRVQEVRRGKAQVLSAMHEAFVCNSVIGIWPVTQLANKLLSIGRDTRHFQAAIGRSCE
jgi:4-amino-4-deoxychorismate lyase